MSRAFIDFGVLASGNGVVNQPPVASFTATVAGLKVTFDGSASTDPDGTITNYSWDPGDGSAWGPNAASFTKTYAAAGTFTVTLYVKDNGGIQRKTSKTITVGGGTTNNPPTAAFTLSATNLVASANGSGSTDSDGSIASYNWNWGDGSTHTTGATSTHTYAAAGTYTVTLIVTDNLGATGTTTHAIAVSSGGAANQAPTASFSWSAASLTVSVDGSSSNDPDGSIASYDWNWGDGTAHGSKATASHSYASGGSYTVTLTVTDNQGATDPVSHSVSVTSPSSGVPAWNHMVVVMLENTVVSEVYNSSSAPWMTAFANAGVRFSQSFGIGHPSLPNYLHLFAGTNYSIVDDNQHWLSGANIYTQMKTAGQTFKAYSEDLPSVGYTGWTSGNYAARHCPWVLFQQGSYNTSSGGGNFDGNLHRPFTEWQQTASFFSALPRLTFVIPNVKDDAHDPSTRSTAISTADAWLKNHLDSYWQWAKNNNSMLFVQFDESEPSQNNQIYSAIGGAHCAAGTVYSGTVNHHTFTGLFDDVMNLPRLNGAVGQPTIDTPWS